MFNISFVKTDYNRVIRATRRVTVAAKRQLTEMPKRASIRYTLNIIQAINSQKYGWIRFSPVYEEWKLKKGFTPKKWILSGELLQAIGSHRLSGTGWQVSFFGGIPGYIRDSGGKNFGGKGKPMKIAQYAHWLEYGRTGQPPRPLFVPEFESFKAIWKLEMFRVKTKMRAAWR